jgi:hypothetical protein
VGEFAAFDHNGNLAVSQLNIAAGDINTEHLNEHGPKGVRIAIGS